MTGDVCLMAVEIQNLEGEVLLPWPLRWDWAGGPRRGILMGDQVWHPGDFVPSVPISARL